MISNSIKNILRIFMPLILFGSLVFVSTGCDPSILLRVENQNNCAVTIFINEDRLGTVPTEHERTYNTMLIPYRPDVPWAPDSGKYLIEAKTEGGKVVYSENFTWQELDDMDWRIVIPASANR